MKSIASTAIVALVLGLGGFAAGAAEGGKRPAPPIPDWAKQYDKNGDGVLDATERATATKARKDESMKRFDKNGDGKLDLEEKKAMDELKRKERDEALAKQKTQKAELEKTKEGKKEEKKEEKK